MVYTLRPLTLCLNGFYLVSTCCLSFVSGLSLLKVLHFLFSKFTKLRGMDFNCFLFPFSQAILPLWKPQRDGLFLTKHLPSNQQSMPASFILHEQHFVFVLYINLSLSVQFLYNCSNLSIKDLHT